MATRRLSRAKRTYSDQDKGKVYAFWIANNKNTSRTARETAIPLATIRGWIGEWEKNGGPPVEILEEAELAGEEFIRVAENLRDEMLLKIRELLPQATIKQFSPIMTGIGILTDKIDRTRGLATERVEHRHVLPSAEEAAALVAAALGKTLEATQARQEIIDAEIVVEQAPRALPAPASYEGE